MRAEADSTTEKLAARLHRLERRRSNLQAGVLAGLFMLVGQGPLLQLMDVEA